MLTLIIKNIMIIVPKELIPQMLLNNELDYIEKSLTLGQYPKSFI